MSCLGLDCDTGYRTALTRGHLSLVLLPLQLEAISTCKASPTLLFSEFRTTWTNLQSQHSVFSSDAYEAS